MAAISQSGVLCIRRMAENEALLRRIRAALKAGDPIEALARTLPATDLASLLLHVFATRTEGLEARTLLQRFEALRAAQPNPNDPRALNAIAAEAYGAAPPTRRWSWDRCSRWARRARWAAC